MKKCINNKRMSSAILALLVLLFAIGVFFACTKNADGFYLKKYANADAKFYKDYIITSVDEGVLVMDFKGNTIRTYEGLKASWMYVYPDENLVVYSNHDNETHLLRLDEEMQKISDDVILESELLAIDPTICKVGDTYLVTHTTIEGTINNPEPNGKNGVYTLQMYASKNLKDFEHRSTIVSEQQDIEDIDMIVDGENLYCIYEKEDYDKGPSKICMRSSIDGGVTWSGEKILIENGGDNEFSCMIREYDGWRLFYSSDQENPGVSYNGASAYSAYFDADFQHMEEFDQKVDTKHSAGVRLYEVKPDGEKLYLMYAGNYMTDKDFVLESIEYKK